MALFDRFRNNQPVPDHEVLVEEEYSDTLPLDATANNYFRPHVLEHPGEESNGEQLLGFWEETIRTNRKNEENYMNERFGTGLRGAYNRYVENTNTGRNLKMVAKVGLGTAAAVASPSAGFAAATVFSQGIRAVFNGLLEAGQEFTGENFQTEEAQAVTAILEQYREVLGLAHLYDAWITGGHRALRPELMNAGKAFRTLSQQAIDQLQEDGEHMDPDQMADQMRNLIAEQRKFEEGWPAIMNAFDNHDRMLRIQRNRRATWGTLGVSILGGVPLGDLNLNAGDAIANGGGASHATFLSPLHNGVNFVHETAKNVANGQFIGETSADAVSAGSRNLFGLIPSHGVGIGSFVGSEHIGAGQAFINSLNVGARVALAALGLKGANKLAERGPLQTKTPGDIGRAGVFTRPVEGGDDKIVQVATEPAQDPGSPAGGGEKTQQQKTQDTTQQNRPLQAKVDEVDAGEQLGTGLDKVLLPGQLDTQAMLEVLEQEGIAPDVAQRIVATYENDTKILDGRKDKRTKILENNPDKKTKILSENPEKGTSVLTEDEDSDDENKDKATTVLENPPGKKTKVLSGEPPKDTTILSGDDDDDNHEPPTGGGSVEKGESGGDDIPPAPGAPRTVRTETTETKEEASKAGETRAEQILKGLERPLPRFNTVREWQRFVSGRVNLLINSIKHDDVYFWAMDQVSDKKSLNKFLGLREAANNELVHEGARLFAEELRTRDFVNRGGSRLWEVIWKMDAILNPPSEIEEEADKGGEGQEKENVTAQNPAQEAETPQEAEGLQLDSNEVKQENRNSLQAFEGRAKELLGKIDNDAKFSELKKHLSNLPSIEKFFSGEASGVKDLGEYSKALQKVARDLQNGDNPKLNERLKQVKSLLKAGKKRLSDRAS